VPIVDLARIAAESFRRAHSEIVSRAAVNELAGAIELALLMAVRAQRRECGAECKRRGEFWQKAAARPGATEDARLEAERGANEALYLADSIAVRGSS
jgi:hypothetical protein